MPTKVKKASKTNVSKGSKKKTKEVKKKTKVVKKPRAPQKSTKIIKDNSENAPQYLLSIDVGTKNFAYCLLDVKKEEIIKWDVISIESPTHEGSCKKLAEHLDNLELTKSKNPGENIVVVIELQPKVNIKTIVISGQVQMYYVLEKLSWNELQRIEDSQEEAEEEAEENSGHYCKIDKIISYHARNKLKYYKEEEGDEPIVLNCKKGYYRNKRLGVEHTKRILKRESHNEVWLDTIMESKKKDDLADAFLQGRSYIYERGYNGGHVENRDVSFRNV